MKPILLVISSFLLFSFVQAASHYNVVIDKRDAVKNASVCLTTQIWTGTRTAREVRYGLICDGEVKVYIQTINSSDFDAQRAKSYIGQILVNSGFLFDENTKSFLKKGQ